jgi:cell division protein FtsL
MTQISIAPRLGAVRDPFASTKGKDANRPHIGKPMLGKPQTARDQHGRDQHGRDMRGRALHGTALPATGGDETATFVHEEEEFEELDEMEQSAPSSIPGMRSAQPETLEKVVKRIPTLYVIAFFAVVVTCAVSIIWNTLQVNRLTLEKTRATDRIAQTEQRLIKLRAQEMQLSAPSRIRSLAREKLGMIEETGSEVVFVKQ